MLKFVLQKKLISNTCLKNIFWFNNPENNNQSSKPKLNIIYFGSDDVALPTLIQLSKSLHKLEVVTHFTRPGIKIQNRVQKFAKQNSIKSYTPITSKNKQERKEQWKKFEKEVLIGQQPTNRDLGIILSYGYMIPNFIIKHFTKGIIVAHPSLLPKYRGAAPIFHAIANGDQISGTTFIEISNGVFDAGNILFQVETKLSNNQFYKQTQTQLAELTAKHINYVIDNIDYLRPGIPQDPSKFTKAPMWKETFLNLNENAEKVYNLSRAVKKPRLKLRDIEMIVKFNRNFLDQDSQQEAGSIKIKNKRVYIKCKDRYLELIKWQQPSKGQLNVSSLIDKYLKKDPTYKFI